MNDGIGSFLSLLDLEKIEENIFRGQRLQAERERVFGGQVAAQALVAAGRTVEHGLVHSLHAYFLRPGDPLAPILYQVDRIHDGRSFTTRRVVAIQHGRAIFNLACSFHDQESGLEHQDPMPAHDSPEDIPPLTGIPLERPSGALLNYLDRNGIEIRFVEGPNWSGAEQRDRVQVWFKSRDALPDTHLLHAAIVTFASDLTLVGTILHRHGLSPFSTQYFGASLDHCMWFHRPFRADEWLFYDQTSPAAYGALGLAIGALYQEDGTRVATVGQEGLVRLGKRP